MCTLQAGSSNVLPNVLFFRVLPELSLCRPNYLFSLKRALRSAFFFHTRQHLSLCVVQANYLLLTVFFLLDKRWMDALLNRYDGAQYISWGIKNASNTTIC